MEDPIAVYEQDLRPKLRFLLFQPFEELEVGGDLFEGQETRDVGESGRIELIVLIEQSHGGILTDDQGCHCSLKVDL